MCHVRASGKYCVWFRFEEIKIWQLKAGYHIIGIFDGSGHIKHSIVKLIPHHLPTDNTSDLWQTPWQFTTYFKKLNLS